MERSVNKGGRPPKPDYKKRSHTVTVRFSAAEYGIVQSRAKRANLEMTDYLRAAASTGELDATKAGQIIKKLTAAPVSEFIRYAALKAEVRKAVTPEELAVVKELAQELRNVGTNVNAIARKANSDLARNYTKDLEQILAEFSAVKDKTTRKMLEYGWKD